MRMRVTMRVNIRVRIRVSMMMRMRVSVTVNVYMTCKYVGALKLGVRYNNICNICVERMCNGVFDISRWFK